MEIDGSTWLSEALRSEHEPWGRSGLDELQAQRILLENRHAIASLRLIQVAIVSELPCMLIAPATSMFWNTGAAQTALNHTTSRHCTFSACAFGMSDHRTFRIVCWHCGEAPYEPASCSHRRKTSTDKLSFSKACAHFLSMWVIRTVDRLAMAKLSSLVFG